MSIFDTTLTASLRMRLPMTTGTCSPPILPTAPPSCGAQGAGNRTAEPRYQARECVPLCRDIIHKMTRNGNLRVLRSKTRGWCRRCRRQATHLYPRHFDAAVFALASLGHTEVKRIVHILTVHLADQQTNRTNHHHGVGALMDMTTSLKCSRLQMRETPCNSPRSFWECRRNDMMRSESDPWFTPMHCRWFSLQMFRNGMSRDSIFSDFSRHTPHRCIPAFERARGSIVAWIDAHLLGIKSRHISHVRIEMHVATNVVYPLARRPALIFFRFSASRLPCVVNLTSSPPALMMRSACGRTPRYHWCWWWSSTGYG